MSSLEVSQVEYALRNDPQYLIDTIIANNPQAVFNNLKVWFNYTTNDATAAQNYIKQLCKSQPEQSEQIIMKAFDVPIVSDNLNDVGQEAILMSIINKEKAGFPTTRNQPYEVGGLLDEIANTPNETTPESNFNWGSFISGALPGVLSLFGVNTGGQQGTNIDIAAQMEADAKKSRRTWTIIIVMLLLILLIIFYIWWKRNRQAA